MQEDTGMWLCDRQARQFGEHGELLPPPKLRIESTHPRPADNVCENCGFRSISRDGGISDLVWVGALRKWLCHTDAQRRQNGQPLRPKRQSSTLDAFFLAC